MARRKKTRWHSRWRADCDYVASLSDHDRAWLEKFHDEYYRCDFGDAPLHPPGELRRDVYRAQNAAERDVVTAPAGEVTAAITTAAAPRPSVRSRYYTPDDYRMFAAPRAAGAAHDDLAELVDSDRDVTPAPPARRRPA